MQKYYLGSEDYTMLNTPYSEGNSSIEFKSRTVLHINDIIVLEETPKIYFEIVSENVVDGGYHYQADVYLEEIKRLFSFKAKVIDRDQYVIGDFVHELAYSGETFNGFSTHVGKLPQYVIIENGVAYEIDITTIEFQNPFKNDEIQSIPDEPVRDSYQDRLVKETKELAIKIHKLEDFMRTKKFYELNQVAKDLMYEQQRLMSSYIQVLGKRCSLECINLEEYDFWEE